MTITYNPKSRTVDPQQSRKRTNTRRDAIAHALVPKDFDPSQLVRIYRGTLSPDQRPVGLGPADALKVLFRSTDFNHEYLWKGNAWEGLNYDAGDIVWRIAAPSVGGYAMCDGSTVTTSQSDGTTASLTTPNLIGYYAKGATSAGANVAAVAPTSSTDGDHDHFGSTVSVDSHHHGFAGTTGTDGNHSHSVSITDPGHIHAIGIGGGTTGSAGAHDHGGATNNGANDGTHSHSGTADSHAHGLSGSTDSEDVDSHTHGSTGLSGSESVTAFNIFQAGSTQTGVVSVSFDGITGDTDDTTGTSHSHGLSGSTDSAAPGVSVGPDGDHHHAIASDGSHAHSYSIGGYTNTNTTGITASTSTTGDHSHTYSGTTDDTEPGASVTIATDGDHSHTISLPGDPVPHKNLIPYIRL